MSVDKQANQIKNIAWHLVAKNLVKFVNDEKSYKLTDKVLAANDFTKYPLSKGDSVEVGIVDNTVTYLRKQKSDAPKTESKGSEEAYEPTPEEEAGTAAPAPEVKKEEPKAEPVKSLGTEDAKTIQILTVFAVAANKKVVKFLEVKDAGWFQLSEAIQAQDYKVIGIEARNKVQVTFNDKIVISVAKVASEPAEQPKIATSSHANAKVEPTAAPAAQAPAQAAKREWKPSSQYNDDRQNSIECQAMINSACDVVGRVAATIDPKPTANVINGMIRAIAEANYALLKELKSK